MSGYYGATDRDDEDDAKYGTNESGARGMDRARGSFGTSSETASHGSSGGSSGSGGGGGVRTDRKPRGSFGWLPWAGAGAGADTEGARSRREHNFSEREGGRQPLLGGGRGQGTHGYGSASAAFGYGASSGPGYGAIGGNSPSFSPSGRKSDAGGLAWGGELGAGSGALGGWRALEGRLVSSP